jgi:NitT/TauT family transport system substrate-binding protein
MAEGHGHPDRGRQVTVAPPVVSGHEAGRRRRPASPLRSVAAVVIALLVAAACGGSRPTATSAPSGEPSPTASARPTATPEPSPDATLTPVRLQLRWTLGAEFAGYVAAVDQGYFEAAGLGVTIIEGGPDMEAEALGSLRDGPEFTISWVPRVLAARASVGSDLVDIAQMFRRSSTLTMSFRDAEITSPAAFADKNVGVLPGADRLEVTAAMAEAGVDPEREATLVDLGATVEPLLTGEIDVGQVTLHDTYATVLETTDPRTGRPYDSTDFDVINLEDEGTAMLQDAVFARASWLDAEEDEATARAFLKASAQGWMYCRDHPADCVESVVAAGGTIGVDPSASPSASPSGSASASPETRLSAGHEAWAMNEVNPLIWPAPTGIGVMDPEAWQHTVDVLLAAGAIPTAPGAEAYRTDLMEAALETLADLDTTGEAFVKGTAEITPRGG